MRRAYWKVLKEKYKGESETFLKKQTCREVIGRKLKELKTGQNPPSQWAALTSEGEKDQQKSL